MTALDALRAIVRGERPASGLLQTARLEAFGVESYGEEAIIERCSRAPFDLSEDATVIAAQGHVAVFDGDTAVVADLYDETIARIWLLRDAAPTQAEPGISVAFDPDMAQARGSVFMAASDHPELEAGAADCVMVAGRAIARADRTAYRARAFAIRAFGTAARGAALFAVFRLEGEPRRSAGFFMTAALWTPDGMQLVRDPAGERAVTERAWTPCIPA